MGKPWPAIRLKRRCPSGVNILLMAASVCSIFIIAHTSSAHALYYQQGKPRDILFPTHPPLHPCTNWGCWHPQQPLCRQEPSAEGAMHVPSRRGRPRLDPADGSSGLGLRQSHHVRAGQGTGRARMNCVTCR